MSHPSTNPRARACRPRSAIQWDEHGGALAIGAAALFVVLGVKGGEAFQGIIVRAGDPRVTR